MLKKGAGSIINIASINGVRAVTGMAAYNASKAAVISLTQTLACELSPLGIRVNAILPAQVETPMIAEQVGAERVRREERIPMGRYERASIGRRRRLSRLRLPARRAARLRDPMSITFSDVDEILRIVERFPAAEIRFEHGDLKLYIKRAQHDVDGRVAAPAPLASSNASTGGAGAPERPVSPSVFVHPPSPAAAHVDRTGQLPIESPVMGVFYAAPSPEAPPFVTVGQAVTKGTELCIIEVMKVMNLIKSPVDGKIVDILAANGTAVELGQPLMWISPSERA